MTPTLETGALLLLGAAAGCLGTLMGAGGGFLLVPVLTLLHPREAPAVLSATSLAVVAANSLSGTWAYARQGRVDYRAGLLFAAATMPGAVVGAIAAAHISRGLFERLLGALLAGMAVLLLLRPEPVRRGQPGPVAAPELAAGAELAARFNPAWGAGLSFAVGVLSSLLGIGGGIIHVPVLVHLLGFPVHVATATSHFVLSLTALVGTATHAASGVLTPVLPRVVALAAGAIPGAQLGAALSTRMRGAWILRALAVAIGTVGLRLLLAPR